MIWSEVRFFLEVKTSFQKCLIRQAIGTESLRTFYYLALSVITSWRKKQLGRRLRMRLCTMDGKLISIRRRLSHILSCLYLDVTLITLRESAVNTPALVSPSCKSCKCSALTEIYKHTIQKQWYVGTCNQQHFVMCRWISIKVTCSPWTFIHGIQINNMG